MATASRTDPLAVLKQNRERAVQLASQAGGFRTRGLLTTAQRDLEARLRKAEGLRGPGADSFTAAQVRVTLEQVRDVQRALKPELANTITGAGKEAAEEAAAGTLKYLQDGERAFRGVAQPLAIDEVGMLDRVVRGTESSILHRISTDPTHRGHRGVLDRYGDNVIADFEKELQLRFVARRPWAEVRDSLVAKSSFLQGAPAHWAERIVRTEVMAANNRAGWETIRTANQTLGDMLKVLCATFDHRTAADSYAVHGQIRRPDEAFESWFGLYQHPPNRPNDREVPVPHRASWPLPAILKQKSDAEVAARWAAEGRKGSPPARPTMSTVDLAKLAAAPAPSNEVAKEEAQARPVQVPVPVQVAPAPRVDPEDPPVEVGKQGLVGPVPVPARVRRGGYVENYRTLRRGIVDEKLGYNRDPESFRDESFKAVLDVYAKELAAGKTATQVATEVLDPITITVAADGVQHIRDGRHRYVVAQQKGAEAIRARVVQYGPQGGIRWEQEMVVPLPSKMAVPVPAVATEPAAAPPAPAPVVSASESFERDVRGAALVNVQKFGDAGINAISTATVAGHQVFIKPAAKRGENGSRVTFDPVDAVHMHQAVHETARELGVSQMVQPAILHEGAFMTKSAGVGMKTLEHTSPEIAAKVSEQDRLAVALIDHLHQNADRHSGNVLIGDDGRVTLIDHDRSHGHVPNPAYGQAKSVFFLTGHLGYESAQGSLGDLPAPMQRYVQGLAASSVEDVAKRYHLTEAEAAAMKARAVDVEEVGLNKALAKSSAKAIRDENGDKTYIKTVGRE